MYIQFPCHPIEYSYRDEARRWNLYVRIFDVEFENALRFALSPTVFHLIKNEKCRKMKVENNAISLYFLRQVLYDANFITIRGTMHLDTC